jgi:predicted esterase
LYPGGVTLIYPSGERKLNPSEVPGYEAGDGAEEKEKENDWRAWWTRDSGTGEYVGLEEGLKTIRDAIEEVGGVDGVIGFSQGAAAAAFVASLLESGRQDAFICAESKGGIRFPPAFLKREGEGRAVNNDKPLEFAVSYSGFLAPDARYQAFYEPKIKTPMLHFIGSLDSVVEEDRSVGLVERTESGKDRMIVHPGGHFVPIGKEWVAQLAGFIREICGGGGVVEKEVGLEDMDLPF